MSDHRYIEQQAYKNFSIIFTNICTNIWKQIMYNYIFHSIAIHKCIPSDRKIYPRLGTPV